jgi:hypothetical protein
MKTLFFAFMAAGLTLISIVGKTEDISKAVKEDCFKAHKALMSKPAAMTVERCWQAHGHLMK